MKLPEYSGKIWKFFLIFKNFIKFYKNLEFLKVILAFSENSKNYYKI